MPSPHPCRRLGGGGLLDYRGHVRDWVLPGWYWEVLPSGARNLVRRQPVVDPGLIWWRSRGPVTVGKPSSTSEVVSHRVSEEDEHEMSDDDSEREFGMCKYCEDERGMCDRPHLVGGRRFSIKLDENFEVHTCIPCHARIYVLDKVGFSTMETMKQDDIEDNIDIYVDVQTPRVLPLWNPDDSCASVDRS
nr:serine/arginine repetitive matrix protein 1-like [Triticum aestivum]